MSRIYEAFTKTRQDIMEYYPDEVKAEEEIPAERPFIELPPLLVDTSNESADEFLCLYKNLRIAAPKDIRTLLVCGVGDKEVTANVTLNLGAVIARGGNGAVLFVEGNLYRPVLHRFLKGRKTEGFCELLTDFKPLAHYVIPTSQTKLFAIRAGGKGLNDHAGFQKAALEHVISSVTSEFSFILFDAPPAGTRECLELASHVDGVALVITSGTPAGEVEKAKEALERAQVNILGAVFNR